MLNTMKSNLPLSEEYSRLAEEWVDLNSAASLLEDCAGAVFSQIALKQEASSNARAELLAKGSTEWSEYQTRKVEARKKANYAKIQMEVIRMKFWEWQSHSANNRVQAKL